MVTFSLPEFSSVDRPSLSMDAQSVPWSESNEDSESANAMATQDSTSDPAVPAKKQSSKITRPLPTFVV
jgi:hypothetical protein